MTDIADMFVDLTRARMRQNPSEWLWLGFNTHRLKPLMSSAILSSPTEVLSVDVRGSVGKQITTTRNWGSSIGDVDKTHSVRDFFRKVYDASSEPSISVRHLWGDLRSRLVMRPVLRYAYIQREGVYMLWHYRYVPQKNIVWSEEAQKSVAEYEFEKTFTVDIFAADQVPLEHGDTLEAIGQAHDEEFLYDIVRPSLLKAHGEPSPMIRRESGESPRYIKTATPITVWVRQA